MDPNEMLGVENTVFILGFCLDFTPDDTVRG